MRKRTVFSAAALSLSVFAFSGLSGCGGIFGPFTNLVDPAGYTAYVIKTYTNYPSLSLDAITGGGALAAVTGTGLTSASIHKWNGSSWVETALDLGTFSSSVGSVSLLRRSSSGILYAISSSKLGSIYRINAGAAPTLLYSVTPSTVDSATNFIKDFRVASDGSLYATVPLNHQILRITAAGVASVIAGTGAAGSAGDGDGGLATAAKLSGPQYVQIGPDSCVYFTDVESYTAATASTESRIRLRKIDTGGVLSFVGFTGDMSIDSFNDDYPNYEGTLVTSLSVPGTMTSYFNGFDFDGSGNLFFCYDTTIYVSMTNGTTYTAVGWAVQDKAIGSENPFPAVSYSIWPNQFCIDRGSGILYVYSNTSGLRGGYHLLALTKSGLTTQN